MTDKSLTTIKQPAELSLKQMVERETKNRKILTEFISSHMKEGVDYGKIHFSSNCAYKYDTKSCTTANHWSKDCLFKPGSEKFASLMRLTPRFHKDTDTWEMAGSRAGLFTYVCELVNPKGEVIGEGRGAADLNEKSWSTNNAVKIAQKRAQIDAVLRTGGLSDFFTQDLEDMPEPNTTHLAHGAVVPTAQIPASRMTFEQQKKIFALITQKGKTKLDLEAYIEKKFNKDSVSKLTVPQASIVIEKLSSLPDAEVEDDKIDINDIPEDLGKGI